MAIRQYVGARYVLKIYENSLDPSSADWEANTYYEPLIMVNYNSSSYISRKDVPPNVGNPVNNPEYWALSGLYNGQIAALQNQIDAIVNTDLPGLQNDIDTLNNTTIPGIQGDINTINNTTIPGIQGDINTINNTTIPAITSQLNTLSGQVIRKALYIGNSYANQGVYAGTKDFFSGGASLQHIDGAGFLTYTGHDAAHTFYQELTNATADNDVTDIVVVGAVGERRAMQTRTSANWIADMKTAISDFETLAASKFPNAKIWYFHCSNLKQQHTSSSNTPTGYEDYQGDFWVHNLMPNVLANSKIIYGGWVGWDLLFETSLFADLVHPTAAGYNIISKNILKVLNGGQMEYDAKTYSDTIACNITSTQTQNLSFAWAVRPDYTIGTVKYSSGSLTAESLSGTVSLAKGSAMSFFPPVGGYGDSSGGLTCNKREQIRAAAKYDSTIALEIVQFNGERTPEIARQYYSGDTLPASTQCNRFPTSMRYDHNPLLRNI